MRILIIEDEHFAAKRMRSLILENLPDANIVEVLDSVEDSVNWLSSNVHPNLIFMDIQLADGLSFQIFNKVKINCPIIFTTAYDEYALNAFKVNSIDYLLKPLESEALRSAINKYQELYPTYKSQDLDWNNITQEIFKSKGHFKKRFLFKSGSAYAYLKTEDIGLVYSEDGLSFAYNKIGKKIILDHSLDKIHGDLDPNNFFRINRKFIIALDSITKVHPYLNNRLKLDYTHAFDEELVVARDRVKEFKAWLDQ